MTGHVETEEYLSELERKRSHAQRRRRRWGLIALVLLAFSIIPLAVARYRVGLPMTPAATRYLWNTTPFSFSRDELRSLLPPNTATDELIRVLVWVYWSPGILIALSFISLALSLKHRSRLDAVQ